MATDLTKMVEFSDRVSMEGSSALHQLLLALAAEIEANREKNEDNLSRLIMIWDLFEKQKEKIEANREEIEKLKTKTQKGAGENGLIPSFEPLEDDD